MKKNTVIGFTATFLMFVIATIALAALPQTMSYQGYLTNGSGTAINAPTAMTFSLYSSNPHRNNPVWKETQPPQQPLWKNALRRVKSKKPASGLNFHCLHNRQVFGNQFVSLLDAGVRPAGFGRGIQNIIQHQINSRFRDVAAGIRRCIVNK